MTALPIPMPAPPPGLDFGVYDPSESAEALALEARCAQGRKFRLAFERPYFHRRAQNFDTWRLVTARSEKMLIGICGGAIKDVVHQGRPKRALFLFDGRVDPDWRRTGVARCLASQLIDWAAPQAEMGYTYTLGDNLAVATLARRWIGAAASPGYSCLIYPVYRHDAVAAGVTGADPREVHASMKASAPAFDLYSSPDASFLSSGLVGSWIYAEGGERAGCSAWNNEGIFSEIVERLPLFLRLARGALASWPLRLGRWPHLPAAGERLKSWYVFDFHASSPKAARALTNAVAAEAMAAGIDYCNILHLPASPWLDAVRRQLPSLFSPVIPYSILARTIDGEPLPLKYPYTNIQDL